MSFLFIFNYIGFVILSWSKIPIKIYLCWIIGIFSIIAFLFNPYLTPYDGVDLVRHFDSLDYIRLNNSENLYIEAPLSALYINIIADTFENNHFLPLISVWIFYGISFLSLFKFLNHSNVDDTIKRFSISIFLCLFVFFGAMNNIRYPIATAMFMFVLFYDVVKRSSKAKFFYLIPVCMHPGIIFAVIIRVLAEIKIKYVLFALLFLCLAVDNFFEYFIINLASLFSAYPSIQAQLIGVAIKFIRYSQESVYKVPMIYRVLSVYEFFLFCMLFLLANNCKSYFNKKILFRMSVLLIIIVSIGLITNFMEGNFTGRVASIMPFLSVLMVADILKYYKTKNKNEYITIKIAILIPSFLYLAVYLFKIYNNWLYIGL